MIDYVASAILSVKCYSSSPQLLGKKDALSVITDEVLQGHMVNSQDRLFPPLPIAYHVHMALLLPES